jgi:hypothetical protein
LVATGISVCDLDLLRRNRKPGPETTVGSRLLASKAPTDEFCRRAESNEESIANPLD